MAIRFHLDEHVDEAIALALRRRGIDVTTTVDAGLTSRPDAAHIAFAKLERRVIYTNDRDFLRHAAAGVEHAGVVFNRAGTRTIREVIEHLLLIDACIEQEEMKNRVEYL